MAPNTTRALIAALCLISGYGLGYLFGPGRDPVIAEPLESLAEAVPDQQVGGSQIRPSPTDTFAPVRKETASLPSNRDRVAELTDRLREKDLQIAELQRQIDELGVASLESQLLGYKDENGEAISRGEVSDLIGELEHQWLQALEYPEDNDYPPLLSRAELDGIVRSLGPRGTLLVLRKVEQEEHKFFLLQRQIGKPGRDRSPTQQRDLRKNIHAIRARMDEVATYLVTHGAPGWFVQRVRERLLDDFK